MISEKEPPMTEVENQVPAAIARLSPGARDLWDTTLAEHADLSEHGCHVLVVACEALHRRNEAREALERFGLTYVDRFGAPRTRPEVAIERNSQLVFLRALRQLAVNLPRQDVGAPFKRMGAVYSGHRRVGT
jgi:hypothetical protein